MVCRAPPSATPCSSSPTTGQVLAYDNERRLTNWQNTPSSPTTTGQYADAASSGLDDYQARYYDAVLGQFASAESDAAGGLNRYASVHGNPETATDPTGHRCTVDTCGGGGDGGSSSGNSGRCGNHCDDGTCTRITCGQHHYTCQQLHDCGPTKQQVEAGKTKAKNVIDDATSTFNAEGVAFGLLSATLFGIARLLQLGADSAAETAAATLVTGWGAVAAMVTAAILEGLSEVVNQLAVMAGIMSGEAFALGTAFDKYSHVSAWTSSDAQTFSNIVTGMTSSFQVLNLGMAGAGALMGMRAIGMTVGGSLASLFTISLDVQAQSYIWDSASNLLT
jgi:RHS repeat-associated protein